MNKLEKILSLLSTLFAILLFSFLIYIFWNYAKNYALQSCVYSVGSDVVEYSLGIRSFARSDADWYVLTDEEAESVLNEIPYRSCSKSSSQPQDMKERKFKIAVKGTDEHGFEVMVWSKGFDNK